MAQYPNFQYFWRSKFQIMVRKLYFIILFTFALSNLKAGNIDLATARQVAAGFIQTKSAFHGFSLQQAYSDFTVSANGKPVYYIVSLEPEGFIIVPANNAAPPVLGYSLENNYETDHQPENFSAWMDGYAKIINDYKDQNVEPTQENISEWDSYLNTSSSKTTSEITTVGPLIPCNWNQSAPYNYLCPADANGSGGHVYSGCVATAMSQVMYYWRFPQHGTGTHGYTCAPYGYLFADFGNTTYKWEEMVNSTSNENFEINYNHN
jgi:hypothetical protein